MRPLLVSLGICLLCACGDKRSALKDVPAIPRPEPQAVQLPPPPPAVPAAAKGVPPPPVAAALAPETSAVKPQQAPAAKKRKTPRKKGVSAKVSTRTAVPAPQQPPQAAPEPLAAAPGVEGPLTPEEALARAQASWRLALTTENRDSALALVAAGIRQHENGSLHALRARLLFLGGEYAGAVTSARLSLSKAGYWEPSDRLVALKVRAEALAKLQELYPSDTIKEKTAEAWRAYYTLANGR